MVRPAIASTGPPAVERIVETAHKGTHSRGGPQEMRRLSAARSSSRNAATSRHPGAESEKALLAREPGGLEAEGRTIQLGQHGLEIGQKPGRQHEAVMQAGTRASRGPPGKAPARSAQGDGRGREDAPDAPCAAAVPCRSSGAPGAAPGPPIADLAPPGSPAASAGDRPSGDGPSAQPARARYRAPPAGRRRARRPGAPGRRGRPARRRRNRRGQDVAASSG